MDVWHLPRRASMQSRELWRGDGGGVGDMCVAMTGDPASKSYDSYSTHLRCRDFIPSLPLTSLPDSCPSAIIERLSGASAILYRDPSSAGNRVRVAIEELLTIQKVRRFPPGKRKSKDRLTTHRRIEEFKKIKPDVAEILMAVKWIGNSGSHESGLKIRDVLDGVRLLTHAVELLYDKRHVELSRLAGKINRQKGLPRPRSKRLPEVPF